MRSDNVPFLNHPTTWGRGDAWWSTDGIVTDRSGFNYSCIQVFSLELVICLPSDHSELDMVRKIDSALAENASGGN